MMDSNEVELQYRDQVFNQRQHSYELTQKLTYFVISAELVFGGYILLNADKLNGVQGVKYLFAVCGIAACCGVLWRFFYNQTYYNNAHGIDGRAHKLAGHSQNIFYWLYVSLSIMTFGWGMLSGFKYLSAVGATSKSVSTAPTTVPASTPIANPPATPVSSAPPVANSGNTKPDNKSVTTP